MITKENFKASLESLGFQHNNDEVYIKIFDDSECELQADFKHSKLLYPKGIIINDATTSNFSKPENFVVFECVHRLLEKGYKPQHLELEPKWQLGREAKSGKADILVKDNEGNSYLLIECKTTDSKNSEFKKEWERMQNNGGQLLSYYQQDKNVKFLCLYTSDFNGENIIFENYILNMQDNEDYLRKNDFKDSYKNANTNEEVFKVWSEIYKYDASSIGIFERNINAYEVGKNALCFEDLKELQSFKDDSKKHEDGKYHEFAKILRKYNISGKENAFDKLVNLFLCKIYDEIHNKNNLKFVYRGVIADSFEDMQDRLMLLYKEAMSEFLKEEVTFIADETIEKAFSALNHNKKSISSLESEVKGFIKALKFYSNNDFAFLEVHNEELFYQNALVLISVVKLFENLKLTQNKTNQFLGNLFELFLQKGMKQDEGQFFTPVQICEFIMYSLPLQDYIDTKIPKVLDYACGAGHFLNTYANFLQEFCKKENVKEYFSQIYGIEKEYRLSKVAKVSSCMYGQNEINILYADALSSDALESKMNNFSFDILVANPPYSVQGFLETLSEKSRKSYTLFSQQINLETNNNIECFFIERANQLLDDKAITAIILPSSLLNKSGIYEQAREIILQNFDIISIVELGSNTFGATGTNTIILFMQKRISFKNDRLHSQRLKLIQERLDYENLINNDNFKENDLLESYISYRGFEPESYKSFLDSILSDEILENENFKEYKQEFLKSASYKKLKDSKIYKDCEDKKALEEKEFVHFCLEREKEKLLYFALSIENEVLIIKSPSENKEQKKFLGYEWSDRKGSEGLKELNTPYLTPLFERGNPDNQNKLSFLIKQSFLRNEFEIPNDLTQYASRARLVDMIDFSKVEFDKAISLSPSRSLRGEAEAIHNPFVNYRYPLVKLESICKMYQPKTITSTEILEQGKYKVYGANGIIGYFNEYNHKDSEVAMTCRGATCGTINFTEPESWITGNAMVISPLNSKEVLKKFLIYILPLSNISHIITGSAQPQITKTNLSQLKIPLPPLEIQQQIVSECEKIEEQYKTIRMSIEEYQNLIKAILVNCGVIAQDSIGGGVGNPPRSVDSIVAKLEKLTKELIDFSLKSLELSSQDEAKTFYNNTNNDITDSSLRGKAEAIHNKNIILGERKISENANNGLPRFANANLTMAQKQQKDDFNTLKSLLESLPTPPPQGWEKQKLINLCKINEKTYNPSYDTSKEYIYIDIDSVEKGTGKFFTDNRILGSNLPTRARRLADDDSVLISTVRPYLKGFAYIKENIKDSIFSTGFAILKGNEKLESKFLYILFMFSNDLMRQIEEKMPKASYPSINVDDIKTFQIPLPPKEAQDTIVQTIDFIESQVSYLLSNEILLSEKKEEILREFLY